MKVGSYEISDVAPITDYNRGFLEGADWQEGLKKKALEPLQRRIRILELKLSWTRELFLASEEELVGNTDGRKHHCKEADAIQKKLIDMTLTEEEQKL